MTGSLQNLLGIRLLVGFLGEGGQFGWWPTAFYDLSSAQFLAPVFSKTTVSAQYQGVLEAARGLHDEHLSVGNFHLFRLPEEIEQDLHDLLHQRSVDQIKLALLGRDAALDALRQMANGAPDLVEGPTAIGSIKDIHSSRVSGAIAGAYSAAFARNAKTYPYLVA